MAEKKMTSILDDRIAAGLADPITDEERAIAARIRADHERQFGSSERRRRPRRDPDDR